MKVQHGFIEPMHHDKPMLFTYLHNSISHTGTTKSLFWNDNSGMG